MRRVKVCLLKPDSMDAPKAKAIPRAVPRAVPRTIPRTIPRAIPRVSGKGCFRKAVSRRLSVPRSLKEPPAPHTTQPLMRSPND